MQPCFASSTTFNSRFLLEKVGGEKSSISSKKTVKRIWPEQRNDATQNSSCVSYLAALRRNFCKDQGWSIFSLACQVQPYWVCCIQRLVREEPLGIQFFLKILPRFQIWSANSAEITCKFTSIRQTIKHKLNFSCPVSYGLASFVLNRGWQNSSFTSSTCLHAKLN